LFEGYTHSIPVIFSSLEGQYDGQLYVDSEKDPGIAILFTPFNFHYLAGSPEVEDVVNILDEMIFKKYLKETRGKEVVVFCPDKRWEKVLDEVFTRHNGIKDVRKMYQLNKMRFRKIVQGRESLEGIEQRLVYEQSYGALQEYPVYRIYKSDRCISYCAGFMTGKDQVEIDVSTVEEYRGQGYAFEASVDLIDFLLENGFEPVWAAWPYRAGSQNLAISLGFELKDEVSAYIWVEAECGKI